MPFSSQAQRRYLYSQKPEIAKEFAEKTPKGKKLPEHKGDKDHKYMISDTGKMKK